MPHFNVKVDLNTLKRSRVDLFSKTVEFDLDDVWSIRRNVQVSQNVKKGPATNIKSTTKPSFYSRHSGFIGNGDSDNSLGAKRTKRDTGRSHDPSDYNKSWNTQSRSHYSYSDQLHSITSANDEFDFDPLMKSSNPNDETFVTRKNQINICHAMPGAPQPAAREMSARTQRAHKLQQAQHKSMGLGQFAPGQNPYFKQHDENENKVKWKRKGDDFI